MKYFRKKKKFSFLLSSFFLAMPDFSMKSLIFYLSIVIRKLVLLFFPLKLEEPGFKTIKNLVIKKKKISFTFLTK